MSDQSFKAKAAAQALHEAGLLAGIMVSENGSLVSHDHSYGPTLVGGFLGAGLDSRHLKEGELFVALDGENVDGRKFIPQVLEKGNWILAAPSADLINVLASLKGTGPEGGVLWSHDPVEALAVLGSTWRSNQNLKVVAITGTNGKTTTKDILAAMLRARGKTISTAGNFNNHLGLPLTLLKIRSEDEYAVVEMGASALGEISFLAALAVPDVGIITNASEAHLAEFGSLAGIIRGKGELLDHLPSQGLAILNADSPGFQDWKNRASSHVSSFGQSGGDHRWSFESSDNSLAKVTIDGTEFPVPLPGLHNAANVVAALLAARHLGLSNEEILSGLAEFQGSPHRGVLLSLGGRQILDDSYNANPRSMLAAVTTLLKMGSGGNQLAILGAMAELGENSAALHQEIGAQVAVMGLQNLVVVGEEARPFLNGFDESGAKGHYCSTLEAAAEYVAAATTAGDCILIKGSRSSAMENILPLLTDKLDRK